MKKLAIITTHPIQYYAPVFKLLAERERIDIKVFYTLGDAGAEKHDHGFRKAISWDIPLVDGYTYEWVKNTATKPGSHHFKGVVNPEISEQIMAWNPDAVLIYGWAYSGHLKTMRHFKNRVPVYFKGDSTLLNEPTGIRKILRYVLLRWIYSYVDHAFFNGINNKLYFKKYGLKEAQLTFAPHAIDNSRFEETQTEEVTQLRSSLNLTDNDILVLYAGKFDMVKNLSLLLKAFGRLKTNNVHLLLAGDGAEQKKLDAIAADSTLAEYIHFTGFKNQTYMPVLYQAADLVCLPSVSETWGLMINEAMACKKAVLVSDKVGCAADLVQPGINGGIFKSGDEEDLLMHLTQLTASKELLKEYGVNSGRIIKDWSFTKVAEAIEDQVLA